MLCCGSCFLFFFFRELFESCLARSLCVASERHARYIFGVDFTKKVNKMLDQYCTIDGVF